jgi:hypothetical protein
LRLIKLILSIGVVAVVGFAAAQFGNSADRRNQRVSGEKAFERVFSPPERVMAVLRKSCFDCHSQETRWPWYSQLPLIGSELEKHVTQGRLHMNLSDWDTAADATEQADLVAGICETVKMRLMPLPQYLWLHPMARISDADAKILCEWSATAESALLEEN